jgi:hypothetical protein
MRQELITSRDEQEGKILVEFDEVMVADVRGDLTPSQMVEGKLQALLNGGAPGCFSRGTGRPGDLHRKHGR